VPAPDVDCGGTDAPYGAADLVAAVGEDVGDATTVASILWPPATACERFVIRFSTASGAPATTLGTTGIVMVPREGILRVALPEDVTGTAIADTLVDSDLVDRIYAVRSPDGLSLEFHLRADTVVEARGFATTSPATLVIDLRRGVGDPVVVNPPRRQGKVVLLSPAPGPGLYPLRVTGYAAPGSGAVRLRLAGEDGAATVERAVPTERATDAWEGFDVVVSDGPSGSVDLFVGTVDSLGLDESGVTVTLDLP